MSARRGTDRGSKTRESKLNRRQFLGGGVVGASLLLGAYGPSSATAGAAVRGKRILPAGSRPFPKLAPGTDQVPEIDHFVVVMMENHSFDNILGLIGRGDGFTLGANGKPKATNPDGQGNLIHAFPMPTECQTDGVGNDWKVTHEAYDGGTCQGFVTST
jgi:phospholipase C